MIDWTLAVSGTADVVIFHENRGDALKMATARSNDGNQWRVISGRDVGVFLTKLNAERALKRWQ